MIAFLPPISQTTFLTNGWPSGVSPAARRMPRPTSFEPVKAIIATRGSRTSTSPTVAARAGQEMQHVAGHAGLPEDFAHRLGDAAGLRRGLHQRRVAHHQRGGGHAAADRQREVPGLMTEATPRGWCHWWFNSPTNCPNRCGWNRRTAVAGVILAEVDGLAGVGVGLAPRLAGLADHDGRQFVAAIAHQRRRLEDHLRAFQRIAIAPGGKRRRRRGDRLSAPRPAPILRLLAGTFTSATAWAKRFANGRLRKIAHRLVDHRQAVAEPVNGRGQGVPRGRWDSGPPLPTGEG